MEENKKNKEEITKNKEKLINNEEDIEKKLDRASESLAEALAVSFKILKGIMILIIILFLSSGIFTVEQDEVALILMFGKIQGELGDPTLKPGLHWTWPYPISEVVKIPSGKVHSFTIDNFWYYEETNKRLKSRVPKTLNPEFDGYCLTGDANIIHFKWQVRYRIISPYDYYINLSPENEQDKELIKSIICNAIVKITAKFTIHNALRNKIDDLRLQVQSLAQQELDRLNTGIKIQGLAIPELSPPRQVQDVFEAILKAKSERDKKIVEAKNYREQILNKAKKGERVQILEKAKNYALQIKKETESDALYLKKILQLYTNHPEIFIQKHYQDLIEKINKKIQEIFLFTNDVKERELRIKINRNPDLYKIKAPKEF